MAEMARELRQVMGFAVLLNDRDGRRVGFTRAGWAIHPLDGVFPDYPTPYHLNVHASIGSVSKVLTAAAVLHAAQDRGWSCRGRPCPLDEPFQDYLPLQWRDDVHPRFERVTVRHVLQHRAGFRKNQAGASITQRLANGDFIGTNASTTCDTGNNRTPPTGLRCYSNMGGGLFNYLLPYLAQPQEAESVDRDISFGNPTWAYDDTMAEVTGKFYYDYTRQHVFAPAGVQPTCNPRSLLGKVDVAAGYGSRNDRAGSMGSDGNSSCAAGGWVMSISQLLDVFFELEHRNSILTDDSLAMMHQPDGHNLIYGFSERDDGWAWHDDGSANNQSAAVVTFASGYQAAVVVSDALNGSSWRSLDDILGDAYEASLR